MALAKYGVIITELKGKIGGQVFQGGNGTPIVRNNKRTKGNPSRSRQDATNTLQSVTGLWRNLSDPDKATWESLRAAWSFTNRFGDTYIGSAFQVFTSYNLSLLSIGETVVSTPHVAAEAQDPGFDGFSADTSGAFPVTWENGLDGTTAVKFFASPCYSPGRGNNNIRWAFMKFNANVSDAEDNIGSQWEAVYGTPLIGSRIFIRCVAVNLNYPRDQYVTEFSAICTG